MTSDVRLSKLLSLALRHQPAAAAGHRFWRAANGVWLADHVPPGFIDFPGAPPTT